MCVSCGCVISKRTVRWKRSVRITQAYYASFVPVERLPVRISVFRRRFMSRVIRADGVANWYSDVPQRSSAEQPVRRLRASISGFADSVDNGSRDHYLAVDRVARDAERASRSRNVTAMTLEGPCNRDRSNLLKDRFGGRRCLELCPLLVAGATQVVFVLLI